MEDEVFKYLEEYGRLEGGTSDGDIETPFSTVQLKKYFEDHKQALEAFKWFGITPQVLFDMAQSVGGAEIYSFEDMKYLKAIRHAAWMSSDDEKRNDYLMKWIHKEFIKFLIDNTVDPPGGDDSYFDYYPGMVSYYITIFNHYMDWSRNQRKF